MCVGPVSVHTDFSRTLSEFTVTYYKAFTQKYSGLLTHTYINSFLCFVHALLSKDYSHTLPIEHKCIFPGCTNVMVLDGNMKNQREVCLAKDAGYITYPGLPGRIKTGCMASPHVFAHSTKFDHVIRQQKGEEVTSRVGTHGYLSLYLQTHHRLFTAV